MEVERLTSGLSKDVVDLFDVLFSKLTSSLVEVDLGDLENEVGESSANTLDGAEGEHGLALAVNVRVLDSENVNEFLSLDQLNGRCLNNERVSACFIRAGASTYSAVTFRA